MPRRAARVDSNHGEIRKGLRAVGISVADTSGAGDGFPDLVCGFRGHNFLLEVKRPPGPRGGMKGRELTPDQVKFFNTWAGQVVTVTSVDEAIRVVFDGAKQRGQADGRA